MVGKTLAPHARCCSGDRFPGVPYISSRRPFLISSSVSRLWGLDRHDDDASKRSGRLFSGQTDAASARALLRLGSSSIGAVLIFFPLLIRFQLLGMPTGLGGRDDDV